MARGASNRAKIEVVSPSGGLLTTPPTDVSAKVLQTSVAEAENTRAQEGGLSSAPGYERVVTDGEELTTPINRIWQANLIASNRDTRKAVLLGTGDKVFEVKRRAGTTDCTKTCAVKFAVVGDSGTIDTPAEDVAALIRSWNPDFVVHAGDAVYLDGYDPVGGYTSGDNPYEDEVARYYWPFIGGYSGAHGTGPEKNKMFAIPGNHESDFPIEWYYNFWQLPGNERYYEVKRGPVHLLLLSSNSSSSLDDVTIGSTQNLWAVAAAAASDLPWVITIGHAPPYTNDVSHAPGFADVQWPFKAMGVSVSIWAHAHNYERIVDADGHTHIVCGLGGHSIRAFVDPLQVTREVGYNSDYGALLVEADAENLSVKLYARDGTLIDTWTQNAGNRLRELTLCYSKPGDGEALDVIPDFATVEVGKSFQYRAILTYIDGTTEDVTFDNTSWDVSDASVASIDGGLATGSDPGLVTVTATHGDLSATAQLQVVIPCVDKEREWFLCVERTTSMESVIEGKTLLAHTGEAIAKCVENMSLVRDKAALISFSGDYDTQLPDVVTEQPLTSDLSMVAEAAQGLTGDGDSDIGAAIDEAAAVLGSSQHTDGSRGVVVLFVDGPALVTTGGDQTEATAMAAAITAADTLRALDPENFRVVVVGYAVDPTWDSLFESIAPDGYYFNCETLQEYKQQIGDLPYLICTFGDDPYYYGACASPQLDYFGFANWDVPNGVVDLCGEGTNGVQLYDVWPGNGLYVDMAGTNPANAVGTNQYEGELMSKTAYSFTAGKSYRFSIDVAGNGRSMQKRKASILIDIGSIFSKKVTKSGVLDPASDSSEDPFQTYSWTFTSPSTTTAKIRIRFQRSLNDPYATAGLFIDDVVLENITDTITMLSDDFDSENPC